MAVFTLVYQLHEDAGTKHRHFQLTRALHKVQRRFWDRIDGFVLFETAHSIDYLGKLFAAQIEPQHDLFLLQEAGSDAAVLCGANSDRDIFGLLPACHHLG